MEQPWALGQGRGKTPLPILLGLVVLGIAGIAGLLHLTGHSRQRRITSKADALHERHWHLPDDPVPVALVGGSAALVLAAGGPGLVRALSRPPPRGARNAGV